MSLPDQTPKLPKLPFLVGDVVLLGAAWFIAGKYSGPLPPNAVAAVTVCVIVGAILGAVPFLADYARRQDEALDERQRSLEALARTVSTAAEQISIAAGGFNEIAELAHKNLRQAEHLPHKLQEKISEFNARLENAREDDREELEKEIAELRAAEGERLATLAAKIEKAVGELAKLDTAIQKQLAERTEMLGGITDALAASSANIVKAIGSAEAKAIADIETAITRAPFTFSPLPGSAPAAASPAPPASEPDAGTFKTVTRIEPVVPVTMAPFQASAPLISEGPPAAASTAAPETPPAPANEPARPKKRAPRKTAPPENVEPVAEDLGNTPSPGEPDDAPVTAAEVVERVIASDGATRLVATAYIGIGNRLFIRGDGPGLSWDKGVPLQFVSIGKWRWETGDAGAPIRFKLYKNDEIECSALGTLTLDPGYQQEVTAKF